MTRMRAPAPAPDTRLEVTEHGRANHDAVHATPFGELPGAVVIDFPTVDALAHAWDLSASLGRAIEFSPELMPAISSLIDRVCTDGVRAMGLIAAVQEPPADATETERLMAFAGRSIPR